ncbi:MAG: DUF1778 domain-containing protein [Eikenella corrodens]|jgi:hypothetical protein|uniref:N-acetyltransferase n=1 Tax=Myoviridae sp. ctiv53 TaxID=2827703 RepID=A0A8S5TJ32_9CAUD|nr:MAG TPA: N-acetyltransferase [Myoviridae sp. ctiv53]
MSKQNVKEPNQETHRIRNNSPIIQAVVRKQEEITLIKQAAALSGSSVSGFVRTAAIKAARQALAASAAEAAALKAAREVLASATRAAESVAAS